MEKRGEPDESVVRKLIERVLKLYQDEGSASSEKPYKPSYRAVTCLAEKRGVLRPGPSPDHKCIACDPPCRNLTEDRLGDQMEPRPALVKDRTEFNREMCDLFCFGPPYLTFGPPKIILLIAGAILVLVIVGVTLGIIVYIRLHTKQNGSIDTLTTPVHAPGEPTFQNDVQQKNPSSLRDDRTLPPRPTGQGNEEIIDSGNYQEINSVTVETCPSIFDSPEVKGNSSNAASSNIYHNIRVQPPIREHTFNQPEDVKIVGGSNDLVAYANVGYK